MITTLSIYLFTKYYDKRNGDGEFYMKIEAIKSKFIKWLKP